MSKVNKIFVVFLLIAGVLCLAIGTVFAVDFMAEHPEEFACDLKRPVVAANRPFVEPVVEPLNDLVLSDPFVVDFPFDMTVLSGTSFSSPSIYSVSLPGSITGSDQHIIIYNETDSPFAYFVGFRSVPAELDFVSEYTPFQFLYQDLLIYFMEYTFDSDTNTCTITFTDVNEVTTSISYAYNSALSSAVFFRSVAPFDIEVDGTASVSVASYVVDSVPIISDIVDTLVSGLRALGTNVGRAFSTMANAIFINADGTGLSTFGILVVVFAAVSLGLSLTRFVLNFCTSWGKRNR